MIKIALLTCLITSSGLSIANDAGELNAEMVFESIQNDLIVDSTAKLFSASGMSRNIRAYDPINKKMYQRVLLGPVKKKRNLTRSNYTHYRYVTVYNVYKRNERISYLPFFQEECYDDSFYMASWGESRTLNVKLESSIGAKALGLSASVGASIAHGATFSTSRRIKATAGIQAKHIPYKSSETHIGVTYIQTYNSKTGGYGFLRGGSFPKRFALNNQNLGLRVKRQILSRCGN